MTTPATARRVVEALVAGQLLDPGAAARARDIVEGALGDPEHPRTVTGRSAMPKLVEVVAYLGGALVLAAGWLFVMQQWDDLGDLGRTVALLVVTAVLVTAGLGVRRLGPVTDSPTRRRLTGTLLTGAAVTAGCAAGQALESATGHGFGDVSWPAVAGGAVAAVVAAVAYPLARTPLGLLGMLGGPVTAVSALVAPVAGDEALWLGVALFALAALWLALTEVGAFAELAVARTLGVALGLFGAQLAVVGTDEPWPGYLLTLVVVVAGVLLYLAVLDWPYLAAAVLGVSFLVPEVVSDWAGDSLGIVGGVLVAGITLLVASFAGYRLREETTD